jgi:peptide deformylase
LGASDATAGENGSAGRRPILVAPDPGLRLPSAPAKVPDPALRALADEMQLTLREARGLGLAAVQVGEPVQLIVVDIEGELVTLVNPRVLMRGGAILGWEGCLSVPERVARVRRPAELTVDAVSLQGKKLRIRCRGLAARAVAHELDHLAGRLYTDLVSPEELVDTTLHPTPPE